MQDGETRKVELPIGVEQGSGSFLADHRVVLVTLSGATGGCEYEIERDRTNIGRGPDVDLAFDDSSMSREHAAFEIMDGAMRIRDLGSTNGVQVNGSAVLQAELKHGDRIVLGDHEFQFVLEKRKHDPKAYDISEAST